MIAPGSTSLPVRALRTLFRFILALSCAVAVLGQENDPVHIVPHEKNESSAPVQAEDSQSVHLKPFRVDVNLVLVPVTVTDVKSRPVLGLKKNDFRLFENQQRQRIEYFSSEDVPISVGVILDLSASMKDKLDLAKEAVAEFFRDANPADDYFVVTFADKPRLMADSLRSIGTIRASLAEAKAQGHTALLDAIYLGVNQARRSHYKRRALLVISDGGDNRSRYNAGELKRFIEESDVEIYAIGLFGAVFHTPEEWAGKRLLTEMSEATGGRTVTVSNARDLPRAAAAISAAMRSQYVLGYRPAGMARETGWRKIKVEVAPPRPNAEKFQVYWKRGYQAPGE